MVYVCIGTISWRFNIYTSFIYLHTCKNYMYRDLNHLSKFNNKFENTETVQLDQPCIIIMSKYLNT